MVLSRPFSNTSGVTLLELTIAVAIFVVTVGITAQSLVSFYATMDMQNQRVVAIQQCRAVLSEMRTIRNQNPNTTLAPNAFQSAVLTKYPSGYETTGPTQLKNSVLHVNYEEADVTANPLVATVSLNWEDMRGHPITVRLTSAVTDR